MVGDRQGSEAAALVATAVMGGLLVVVAAQLVEPVVPVEACPAPELLQAP